MLPVPELILSIHGVGHHEAGRVPGEIAQALGADSSARVVGFNWCGIVEGYDRDRIVELSASIAIANAQGCPSSPPLRLASEAAELAWSLFFLMLAMMPLLIAPSLALYWLVPDFSLAATGLPSLCQQLLVFTATLALASTSVLLLMSLGAALLGRGFTAVWLARRAFLLTLRPVIALLFWLAGLDHLFRNLGRIGLGLIAFNLFAFLFGQGVGWLFGTSWDIDHALHTFQWASVGVVAALLAGALLGLAAKAFAAMIKFFRDVFNYVGSADTRRQIQTALAGTAADIPPDTTVALACHSLGSVIAVDSLVNSGAWGHVRSIVLVTGGSPIRRWFQRFFPDLYFPRDAGRLAEAVLGNAPVVGWINVFRTRDPVGAGLALPDDPALRDVPSGRTELKGLAAHAHYWTAPDIHRAVRGAWSSLVPRGDHTRALPHEQTAIAPSRVSTLVTLLFLPALALTAATAILFGVDGYFRLMDAGLEANRAFVAEALESGTRVEATVNHRRYWRPGPENSYPVQKFVFTYQTPDGRERPAVTLTEVPGDVGACCQLFDSEGLLEEVRADEDLDEPGEFRIGIAYLPAVTDRIAVPRFPPTVTDIPWYYDLVMLFLYLLFGVVLLGGLGLAASIKFFDLLLLPPA